MGVFINNYKRQYLLKLLNMVILIFFLSIELLSQKAVEYYSLIAKAEESFVRNNLDSSLIFYDSAFLKFDYPFYRNIRQAAIIGSYSNNKKIYRRLLEKCVKTGKNIVIAIKENINPPIVPAANEYQKISFLPIKINGIKPNKVDKIVRVIGNILYLNASKYSNFLLKAGCVFRN